jgi:la-related protein 1
MDSKGWIPIEVLASFPRVKRLTSDSQLVRDVLTLSNVVHVYGKWVRMNTWEQFVFPDAPESVVDEIMSNAGLHAMSLDKADVPLATPDDLLAEEGDVEEEEEEEDVEFVIGSEAGGWTPERR